MKTVAYSCAMVPCEWIAAHGLRPKRLRPSAGATVPGQAAPVASVCSFVRAMIGSVWADADVDAVVITTVCDQMRRAVELIEHGCDKPVFLMNVPATWQESPSHRLYAQELRRLGRFLVSVGGRAPSDEQLADVMRNYDDVRRTVRDARGCLSARQYSQALLASTHGQAPTVDPNAATEPTDGVGLALIGGELCAEDLDVFDLIEQAGGHVVLDATDGGERAQPEPFDRRRIGRTPLAELADAYFGTIPHAFRRPNSTLFEYLAYQVAARAVRGIIFRRYAWCDTWNAELPRLRQCVDVPVLDMDFGAEGQDRGRKLCRVEALLETCR